MTLVLTRKGFVLEGIDLQKLEVIFGLYRYIYIQSKVTYTSICLTSLLWVHFPPNQTTKKNISTKNISPPAFRHRPALHSCRPWPLYAGQRASMPPASGFRALRPHAPARRRVAWPPEGRGCRAWAFGALELQASNVQAWMALCL